LQLITRKTITAVYVDSSLLFRVHGSTSAYYKKAWEDEMGSLLSFYCHFFAKQIIGGAKELVVHLWLSGDI